MKRMLVLEIMLGCAGPTVTFSTALEVATLSHCLTRGLYVNV